MGWMCSWVGVQGVQGVQRTEVLETLGLVETGQVVEPGSGASTWCVGEVEGGWLIVFSEDFDWGNPERVRNLSAFGLTVGLQFEDKVEMTSIACAAQDGVELWRVSHVNSDDEHKALIVTGDPPPAFKDIREALINEQAEADDDSVDYLHDIPIEVAKSACGYRADEWLPPFMAVRPIGAPAEPARAAQGHGFLDFLKGLFVGGR
jgi:hypothetical protein